MTEIMDNDLRVLIRKIKEKTDIDLGQYKDSYIVRRLTSRMKVYNVTTYRDYLVILDKTPGEFDKVVDAFTINVSEFFRDRDVFKTITNKIVPAIVEEKTRTNRRNIRVWSAGCACGEEVYSLSIILHEVLGKNYDKFNIRLYATDIDDACMARAKEGHYDPALLRNVDRKLLEKYTTTGPDGIITVNDEVKKNVVFRNFDLIGQSKFGSYFDLILCRNVMIYFSEEQKARLIMEFCDSLLPGGYLVIGRTEALVGKSRDLLQVISSMDRIYLKPEVQLSGEKHL